ncbi:OmpA family protein [Nannocystis punicea]|uniref:OmpA family protein n=1 Tax=Nannocystis punicea TaxID=2995304 RepID=A0ABY7HF56_9BACT|nr:OmpA family protein [Nannocystis poenicansa]WAS97903.1 OmpA family protein [Nannocystis poenicansa]
MRRLAVTTSLAWLVACSGPHAPERPLPPPTSECAAILATIPYASEAPQLQLDPDGVAELDEWVARLHADPQLRVELGVHMAAAARAGATPADVDARLRRFGDDLLARLRAEVRPPGRVALVVHGVAGGPADEPLAGSWVQLRRTCPPFAPDRDGDGHLDAVDRCIDTPEDYDRFVDDDGCPDRDNDGDGILDAARWTGSEWTNCDGKIERGIHRRDCRDQPETVNGEQDDDGCPEAFVADCGRFVVRVGYDPVTRELDPDAFLELDARRKQLGPRMHTGGVFVLEGHTDDSLPPGDARQLGLDMAGKVRDVLIDRGFVHEALSVRTRGGEQPIADNDSDEGRRANHRVEIVAGLACAAPSSPLCP